MLGFKLLPWDYGVRNIFRRPLRSGLTFLALTLVVSLVFVVVGFIRGLERSLAVSGDPQVAIVYAEGMGENLEYSSIPARTADLLAASLSGVQNRFGQRYASPELYLGTHVHLERPETGLSAVPSAGPVKSASGPTDDRKNPDEAKMGLVRGVTPSVLLVRRQVELVAGKWPGPGEVLVGRLAPTKLGATNQQLGIGRKVSFEGKDWTVSGMFSACGSTFEAELWCRLDDLQRAMKRDDLSLVALTLKPGAKFGEVQLYLAYNRTELEAAVISEPVYYARLQADYDKVRQLAWLVVLLVSGAGVFAGLNTMHAAVMGRVRELATLQTIGFLRMSIAVSLFQEGTLLAAGASLLACVIALFGINGMAVRFTMGAFELRVDSLAVLIGCGTGCAIGLLGSIPPAIRAMRLPVVEALKAI